MAFVVIPLSLVLIVGGATGKLGSFLAVLVAPNALSVTS